VEDVDERGYAEVITSTSETIDMFRRMSRPFS
jgi:hypothetical protein